MKRRGFEIVKGYEDKGINLPVRKTSHSAGYDVEAAEDVVIPMYKPGIKPTLIPTGLKGYCMDDECFLLLNRSSGPKKGFLMAAINDFNVFSFIELVCNPRWAIK